MLYLFPFGNELSSGNEAWWLLVSVAEWQRVVMGQLPSFAANLVRHREGLGLSQADLARRVGVSPSTILRYEKKGGQLPPGALLVALSEVLGVPPKALLGSDARELPAVVGTPRVGRPPSPASAKDDLAGSMLAELRGPDRAPDDRQEPAPAIKPRHSRRTKLEPE